MTFYRSVVVVVVRPEVDDEGCFVCASSFLTSVYGSTVVRWRGADRRGGITAGFWWAVNPLRPSHVKEQFGHVRGA